MFNARDLKHLVIGGILVASSAYVLAAVSIPNTFSPNTPIKSADVNANFSSLKSAVDALQANPVLNDASVTTTKLAAGAVTAPKLATPTPAATGKFLGFDGSSLVWADGAVGAKGDKGDTGAAGAKGDAGTPGTKGDTGATGVKGDAGTPGGTGDIGAVGPKGETGAQGIQGVSGVSGLQRVVNTGNNVTLAGNGERVTVVDCPAGKRIVGGGFVVFNASGRWLSSANGPTSDTQWAVALANISASQITAGTITVTAICATAL